MANSDPPDALAHFWDRLERLRATLQRSRAVNVNSQALRVQARDLAQDWFRSVKLYLLAAGLHEDRLKQLDALLQYLLRLSLSRNAKASYISTLRDITSLRADLEVNLAAVRGTHFRQRNTAYELTSVEAAIIATLERLLPQTAVSYRQAVLDLADPRRVSYRGTATELREVVREVLDHLAPDSDVMRDPGFRLEKDRRAPTMKQKARFILTARGIGETSRKAPEDAVAILEDPAASIVRATYDRGAAATHSATSRQVVQNFKGYADAVLADLLQIHR